MYIASLKVKQQKNRKKPLYCVKKRPCFRSVCGFGALGLWADFLWGEQVIATHLSRDVLVGGEAGVAGGGETSTYPRYNARLFEVPAMPVGQGPGVFFPIM